MTLVHTIEEAKSVLGLEQKADNTVNTEGTGHGAELVPSEEFSNSVITEIVDNSTLLSQLPGNHGSNLPKSLIVPVIGETGFFENAGEMKDTGANRNYNDQMVETAQIKLERRKLIMRVNVSDEMLKNGIDIESYIRRNIKASGSRTCESMLLNLDGSTGLANINDKGTNITATEKRHWFGSGDGLRKKALDTGASVDLGALDVNDFFTLFDMLGEKATNPADCLWITNRRTANKVSQLPELMQEYINGRSSTIHKGTETNIKGSDIYIARDVALTDVDGTVSKTTANNTKGSLLYINKSAPQFGFEDLRIEPKRIEGYGWQFIATFYFAYNTASKLTSTADPSVALGYNITL